MALILKKLYSKDITEYFDQLAQLRIKVFKEYPYLYEGSLEYERDYLARYSNAENSLVIAALKDKQVIGASTCIPLLEEDDDFKKPLLDYGLDIENSFYFGESLILPEYRGNKLGHEFFKIREDHAKSTYSELNFTCFCSVVRNDHPLEPKDYRPLSSFWTRMGYREYPEVSVSYPWKDIDKTTEDYKKMNYWIRRWK